MTDHPISIAPATGRSTPHHRGGQISWRTRLSAQLFSRRLDLLLAVGAVGRPGSALHLRAAHLESDHQRRLIARTLQRVVAEARHGRPPTATTVEVHRRNVADAQDTIDAITLRLHSPRQVNARGMARLRRALADGSGPLYTMGAGNLDTVLRAALATL